MDTITKYSELRKIIGTAHDSKDASVLYSLAIDGKEVVAGTRLMINDARAWNWKSGVAVCCNGETHRITNKTSFLLKTRTDSPCSHPETPVRRIHW